MIPLLKQLTDALGDPNELGDAELAKLIEGMKQDREEFEEEAEEYEHEREDDAKSASRSIDRANAAHINKKYG
jgi:hypothetical protein